MKSVSTLVFLAVLAWSFAARANPISTEGIHGVQVPETMHVQVSYFGMVGMGEAKWPKSLTRNGVPMNATWLGPTSIDHNGGSGVTSFDAMQVCDCGLAPGTYKYKFVWEGDHPTYFGDEVTVLVTDPPPKTEPVLPAEDVQENADVEIMPWDEPESPWPKGADCVKWCDEHPVVPPETVPDVPVVQPDVPVVGPDVPVALDTAQPPADTPAYSDNSVVKPDLTGGDAGTTATTTSDKGTKCSAGLDAMEAAWPSLILLGGIGLAFLRGRRRA